MDYDRRTTYIIGLLTMAFWNEKDFFGHLARPGDWAIEITSISNVVHSSKHDFRAQILKVLEQDDATYRGIRLDGQPQEWVGAMMYRFPDRVQGLLNTLFWDENKNTIKDIELRDTSGDVWAITVTDSKKPEP